ncbi:sperm acrosome membrane-associated protein 1 [Pleurodeles waltl]|uniref:sperm acrosome membrane-associated protein 1 n=1 Tax=Pleurodeles waltl TaxID=8319 RepID=UPI00370973B7
MRLMDILITNAERKVDKLQSEIGILEKEIEDLNLKEATDKNYKILEEVLLKFQEEVTQRKARKLKRDKRDYLTGGVFTFASIGIREVLQTHGCPGSEPKCLVRVEECRGPEDCRWGTPVSETLKSVKMTCNYILPELRFTYSWKKLMKDQQPIPLPEEANTLEVKKEKKPVVYQCDTMENNILIATIKFMVYPKGEMESRSFRNKEKGEDMILVCVIISSTFLCIGVIIGIICLFLFWKTTRDIERNLVPLAHAPKGGGQGADYRSLSAPPASYGGAHSADNSGAPPARHNTTPSGSHGSAYSESPGSAHSASYSKHVH